MMATLNPMDPRHCLSLSRRVYVTITTLGRDDDRRSESLPAVT